MIDNHKSDHYSGVSGRSPYHISSPSPVPVDRIIPLEQLHFTLTAHILLGHIHSKFKGACKSGIYACLHRPYIYIAPTYGAYTYTHICVWASLSIYICMQTAYLWQWSRNMCLSKSLLCQFRDHHYETNISLISKRRPMTWTLDIITSNIAWTYITVHVWDHLQTHNFALFSKILAP